MVKAGTLQKDGPQPEPVLGIAEGNVRGLG
jgi:hypothetical protein